MKCVQIGLRYVVQRESCFWG